MLRNYNTSLIKIFVLLVLGFSFGHPIQAQNGIIGTGFSTGWVNNTDVTCFAASTGTSRILSTNPNGTGNQYFRTVRCWGGNFDEVSPSITCTPSDDLNISIGTPYNAGSTPCTNGAYFINCPNTADNYIFKTPDGAAGAAFVLFVVQGVVNTVTAVNRNPLGVYPKQTVTVMGTTSSVGVLPTGQGMYLRYTDDAWATSAVVEMSYSGGGGNYTADIPSGVNLSSKTVSYYVFTSGNGLTITGTDADWYAINQNNNGGTFYGYTVLGGWTTRAGGDGSWNDPNMWDAFAVPPNDVPVIIENNITLDQDATVSNMEIKPGITFTASDVSPRRISLSAGGQITINGAWSSLNETLDFEGFGSIVGSITLNNFELNGGAIIGAACVVTGILEMKSGSVLFINAPTYSAGATLKYNTGGPANVGIEWAGSTKNVRIAGASTINLTGSYLALENVVVEGASTFNLDGVDGTGSQTIAILTVAGNLEVNAGSTLNVLDVDGNNGDLYGVSVAGELSIDATSTLNLNNDAGDNLYLKGDLTNNGLLNSNERLIKFHGGTRQTLTGIFTGTSMFDFVELDNAAGLQLNADIYVEDDFRLTNGAVFTGNNACSFKSSATVSGTPSATAMFVTDGAGELRKEFSSPGSFLFPIGDATGTAEYSPIEITINSASAFGAGSYISASLKDEKHPNNLSASHFLSRHYTVQETGITDINYDLDLTYLDADITGTETMIVQIKSNDGGTNWSPLGYVNDAANKIALSNQSSFSIFSGGDGAMLPIELLYFEGEKKGLQAHLRWSTATEEHNEKFVVWHGTSPVQMLPIAEVEGANNSTQVLTYAYSHFSPKVGWNYYQLEQLDLNGSSEKFNVVALYFESENGQVQLTHSGNTVQVVFQQPLEEKTKITVRDISGRVLAEHVIHEGETQHKLRVPISQQVVFVTVASEKKVLLSQKILLD